jgi:hypothetical protein
VGAGNYTESARLFINQFQTAIQGEKYSNPLSFSAGVIRLASVLT